MDIFICDLTNESPKNTSLNKHIIELVDGKQLLYGLIYTLSLVELEVLKAYIKIHLKLGFIQLFKSLVCAPIFFDKKPDDSFGW